MAIPAGISTALVHLDAPVSFIGEDGRIHARIYPSIPLVWAATGTPIGNFVDNISLDPGVELAIQLPHVDQPGFLDGSGNTVTGWSYRIEVTYEKEGQNIPFPARDFQILVGQDSVDLALIPTGEAHVPVVAPILTVTSIAGFTGAVTKTQLALNNVDNTSDANKPVSTAQLAALNLKSDKTHKHAAADTTSGSFDWARMPLAVLLPNAPTAHDLNSYVTTGVWHQNYNAGAGVGTNYPAGAAAGLLEVFANPSGTFVYQRYSVYAASASVLAKVHTRGRYNAIWSPWAEQADQTLASSTIPGLMSAADKAKLDAATDTYSTNTLMKRDGAGWVRAEAFFVSSGAVQPSNINSLTRKDYVDGQINTRSATGHGHTYADISGTVPTSALPPLAINDVFSPVANQAAMLALVAQRGDMAIRTDNGKTYVLSSDSPGTLADWKEIMAAGQVLSVNGSTGVVSVTPNSIGLGQVSNTADMDKPVSTQTQSALDLKAPIAAPTFTGQVDAVTLRLSATGDASETSTGHAFQIGASNTTNLIIDNNEIIGRNNGALSSIGMPGGINSLPAPAAGAWATNKDYVDKFALGYVTKVSNAVTTGDLVGTSTNILEGTFNVVAGRNYAVRATLDFYGTTAGNVCVAMNIKTGGTAGGTDGTDAGGFGLWSAPNAAQGSVEQRTAEFKATATGTLRIAMITARLAGSSAYKATARSMTLLDEGIAP